METILYLQETLGTDAIAHASLRWLGHHQIADLSVLSTLTVFRKLHASTGNVKILALVSVEEMHIAESEIMSQYVSVIKDSLGTHSQAATDQQQPH